MRVSSPDVDEREPASDRLERHVAEAEEEAQGTSVRREESSDQCASVLQQLRGTAQRAASRTQAAGSRGSTTTATAQCQSAAAERGQRVATATVIKGRLPARVSTRASATCTVAPPSAVAHAPPASSTHVRQGQGVRITDRRQWTAPASLDDAWP